MHINFLDPYRPRLSVIHRLDARVKLVLTLVFILAAALAPIAAWPVYVLLLSAALAVEILSELGVGHVMKRALLALPFALAAAPMLFTIPGPALLTLPGPWTAAITGPGLERFASITLKSWISVQMAIVLAASTPFPDLLMAMRAIRLPRLLVAIFGLMWRYLFVLADEALRLLRARSARSGLGLDAAAEPMPAAGRLGGTIAWRARVTGGMVGSLFLRSFERADRIYAAMVARGYDGEMRAFPLLPVSPPARGVLLAGLGFLALLTIFGRLIWG